METFFLVCSIGFNCILLYSVINFIKKDERKDQIIENYSKYINKLSNIIEECDVKLKEVDAKGSFEADDEVGFFFKTLKELQNVLNIFKTK